MIGVIPQEAYLRKTEKKNYLNNSSVLAYLIFYANVFTCED